jgi:hypothetical protein
VLDGAGRRIRSPECAISPVLLFSARATGEMRTGGKPSATGAPAAAPSIIALVLRLDGGRRIYQRARVQYA